MGPNRSLPDASGTRPQAAGFPLGEALVLGLVHGPAELLPVSSSAHITLIAWVFDLSYAELALECRKDFEVAVHAGTAAALLIGARSGLGEAAWAGDRRAAAVLALALGPPALAGLAFESGIERLGTPRRIAGGLLLGSVALVLGDWLGSSERPASDARALDGLLLGLAQAAALVPGISRNGATLAVCRGRGFHRRAAEALSRDCGLPVILGASALRAARAWRGQPAGRARPQRAAPSGGGPGRRETGSRVAAGAAGAFVSTVLAAGILERRDRPVSLLGVAAYRVALAAVVLGRLGRRGSGLTGPGRPDPGAAYP